MLKCNTGSCWLIGAKQCHFFPAAGWKFGTYCQQIRANSMELAVMKPNEMPPDHWRWSLWFLWMVFQCDAGPCWLIMVISLDSFGLQLAESLACPNQSQFDGISSDETKWDASRPFKISLKALMNVLWCGDGSCWLIMVISLDHFGLQLAESLACQQIRVNLMALAVMKPNEMPPDHWRWPLWFLWRCCDVMMAPVGSLVPSNAIFSWKFGMSANQSQFDGISSDETKWDAPRPLKMTLMVLMIMKVSWCGDDSCWLIWAKHW
jgi:hypothetical protein